MSVGQETDLDMEQQERLISIDLASEARIKGA